jgi:nucleoside-diphosphate-sugar epimerase
MMRIAVTGASGFVGAALCHHLESRGHELACISRRGPVVGNLESCEFASEIAAAIPACETIVHCGARIEKDILSQPMLLANTLGTQSVIRLAQQWRSSTLIYISSLQVIGLPTQLPIDESHPINPATAYHASKLFGEHLVRLASSNTLRSVSLRVSAPIGPKMPGDRILTVFARNALEGKAITVAGQGSRSQNYVDVRDVARAVELAMMSKSEGVFNIGGASSITNIELAQLCVMLAGSRCEIKLSGTPDPEEGIRWEVSLARAKSLLGYAPAHTLEDSIQCILRDLETGNHQ